MTTSGATKLDMQVLKTDFDKTLHRHMESHSRPAANARPIRGAEDDFLMHLFVRIP
jgi:hypothetical protein